MSDLAAFLGRASAPQAPSEVPIPTETAQEVPTQVTDVTPSGIEVMYQAAPKRLYKVRSPKVLVVQPEWDGWTEVPSVTTVLDVLAKGGLTVWGMRVGIGGVLQLVKDGHLSSAIDFDTDKEALVNGVGSPGWATVESVEALLKEHKLTTNDAKDSAAGRGTAVHDALEEWAKTGQIPKPEDFEENEKGYVEGLVSFLADADPTPVRTEVMVGSVEHGYAGRYDIELQFTETKKVRKTPKQKWHDIDPGVYLTDCKSAKAVYPLTNYRQLAAYEGARVECGYPPTDGQYILNVNGEGSYAFVKSTATLDDFLAVLKVWQSDGRLKKAA